jgi:alpha-tubulin suppressor-like RCC1 family protein
MGRAKASLKHWTGAGAGAATLLVSLVARSEPANVLISAAYNDTCAVKVDGTASCWGFNQLDELGDGTQSDSSSPVAVITVGGGVVEISAGQFHTCARRNNGTLWCWGYDIDGELGNGVPNGFYTPLQVAPLATPFVQVSTGYLHTCARTSDGAAWCWGTNSSGQLGDGTTNNQASPVQVGALGSAVAEISAGADHTCARKTDGSVWCWGANGQGQLGNGTTANSFTPVRVGLALSALEISANNQLACARVSDGSVWCWGDNVDGQLGVGTTTSSPTPLRVTALGIGAAQISAGDDGACAVMTNTTLWCWGGNFHGNVGDGTTTARPTPVEVASGMAEVSMGVHTCARGTDGRVWCWGFNTNGQLGNGGTTDSSSPVRVPIVASATALAPALGRWGSGLLAVALGLAGYALQRRTRAA